MKGTISSKLTSRSSNHAYGKRLKATVAHEKDVVKLNVKALPHVRILSLSDTFVRQQSNSTKTIRVHKSIKHLATPILLSETLSIKRMSTVYMVALVLLLTWPETYCH